MRLVLVAGVAALGLGACAHTVTNEERLDGLTDVKVDSTEAAAEMRCRDASPDVQLARDRSQRKAERLSRYADAIADAKDTQARFDEVFKKEPDLVYGPDAAEWKRKQQGCTDLITALTKEQAAVEREPDNAPPPPPPPAAAEKPAAPPAKRAEPAEEKKPAVAESAADEAFDDDADELRSSYKKKAKVAKAKAKKSKKSKKRKAELANR